MKTKKIIKFKFRKKKKWNHRITIENHKNYEINIISYDNHENNENHRIPYENHENHENLRI